MAAFDWLALHSRNAAARPEWDFKVEPRGKETVLDTSGATLVFRSNHLDHDRQGAIYAEGMENRWELH